MENIKKRKKKKIGSNDKLLIRISKIYLFPLYFMGIFLKIYDYLKVIIVDFVKYKILRRKKEQKVEDWWIS